MCSSHSPIDESKTMDRICMSAPFSVGKGKPSAIIRHNCHFKSKKHLISSKSLPSPLGGTSAWDDLDVEDIFVQYCHLPVQERYNYHTSFYV